MGWWNGASLSLPVTHVLTLHDISQIIYQVGYSGFALFCNLFTADMSSMRERLFWNSITGWSWLSQSTTLANLTRHFMCLSGWPYWINSVRFRDTRGQLRELC